MAVPQNEHHTHPWELTQEEIGRRKSSIIEFTGPHGETRRVSVGELNDADRALAAEFGYKPVFKREFGYLSSFSFAVSISGLFSTVATTFSYPLNAGGASAAVWCWLISGAGCMCIAVCFDLRRCDGGPELICAY